MSPSEHKIVIMFGRDLRDRKEHFNLISEIASIIKYRFGYIIQPFAFPLIEGFSKGGTITFNLICNALGKSRISPSSVRLCLNMRVKILL